MKLGNEIKKALAASMWIGVLIGAALLGAWAQTRSDREHEVFGAKVYVDNSQQVLKSGMSATVHLE